MDRYDWIRAGLAKPGKTRTGLAQAMGWSDSVVTSLLGPEKPRSKSNPKNSGKRRNLKIDEVPRVAAYLEVSPPSFQLRRTVPLLGAMTGMVAFQRPYSDGSAQGLSIYVPDGDTGSASALVIEGGGMRGLISGNWLLYLGDEQTDNFDDIPTGPAVCRLDDGRTAIGVIANSLYPGLYDITELFAEKQHVAQKIVAAAPVTAVIPPAFAQGHYPTAGIEQPDTNSENPK